MSDDFDCSTHGVVEAASECPWCRAQAAGAERDRLRIAMERIADENDPLEGIGSEQAFARGILRHS